MDKFEFKYVFVGVITYQDKLLPNDISNPRKSKPMKLKKIEIVDDCIFFFLRSSTSIVKTLFPVFRIASVICPFEIWLKNEGSPGLAAGQREVGLCDDLPKSFELRRLGFIL